MPVAPVSIPMSESTHFRAISSTGPAEMQSGDAGPPSLCLYIPDPRGEAGAGEGRGAAASPSAMEVEGIGATARLLHDLDDGRDSPSGRALSKTDSPSKRKGMCSSSVQSGSAVTRVSRILTFMHLVHAFILYLCQLSITLGSVSPRASWG